MYQKINRKTPFIAWLDRTCPPFLAYALAGLMSKRRHRHNLKKILAASGLSLRTLNRTRIQMSWSNVRVGVASALLDACGINPATDADRIRTCLERTYRSPKPFPNLTDKQYKSFQRRCALWKQKEKGAVQTTAPQ